MSMRSVSDSLAKTLLGLLCVLAVHSTAEGIPLFPTAQSIPAYRWYEPDVEWPLTLEQAVDMGLVFRKVDEPRGSFWAPGKVVKRGAS